MRLKKILSAIAASSLLLTLGVVNAEKNDAQIVKASDEFVTIIDGSQVSSTATTSDTTLKNKDGIEYIVSSGAKQQKVPGTAKNAFNNVSNAILIGKKDAYIYNPNPFGIIKKFEIYVNANASAKVSVGVTFSDSPISAYSSTNAYTATLSTLDNVYDCSSKLVENTKYFWYQVTNANNSQVAFRITYEKEETPTADFAVNNENFLQYNASGTFATTFKPVGDEVIEDIEWTSSSDAIIVDESTGEYLVGETTAKDVTITATAMDSNANVYESSIKVNVVPQEKSTLQISEAKELIDLFADNQVPFNYCIDAKVVNVTNTKYGNAEIEDDTGTMSIYTSYYKDKSTLYQNASVKFNAGDFVLFTGELNKYNDTYQLKNAIYDVVNNVKTVTFKTATELGFSTEYTAVEFDNSSLKFEKVSSEQTDWSGTYLMVYEPEDEESVSVFNCTDTASNFVEATPVENAISYSDELAKYAIVISKMDGGYSLKLSDGNYMCGKAKDNNGLVLNKTSEQVNLISYTNNAVSLSSNSNLFVFNATADQLRFRYYKSSTLTGSTANNYHAIQLYKLNGEPQDTTYQFDSFSKYSLRFSTSINDLDVSAILGDGETKEDLTYGFLVTTAANFEGKEYTTFEDAYKANNSIDWATELNAKNAVYTGDKLGENGDLGVIINNIADVNSELCAVAYAIDSDGNLYFANQTQVSVKKVVEAYASLIDSLDNLDELQKAAIAELNSQLNG